MGEKLTFNQIMIGLDSYMEEEYGESNDEGNSFFFTGGCYMFADALYSILIENDINADIYYISDGAHALVVSDGCYIDAGGCYNNFKDYCSDINCNLELENDSLEQITEGNNEPIEMISDVVYYRDKLYEYSRKELF